MESSTWVKRVKAQIRERIWRIMEELDLATFPRPVHGRIPNFKGAEKAAERIFSLKVWSTARVIKSNPDSPQYYVRLRALEDGKILVMASPRLTRGFLILDPARIPRSKYVYAATIKGALMHGKIARLTEIPPIDLIITGCVAIDRSGGRVGKGGGYCELEYGILRELGLVSEQTPVITTIHDVQLIDEKIPLEVHDITVDYYATPSKLVEVSPKGYKPGGIYWSLLRPDLRELGVIKELACIKGIHELCR